jgi:tetratricopeptide (TPR) repeat protein
MGLRNKALTLRQLDRREDEIAVYDEVVVRLATSTESPLREQLVRALINKGVVLGALDRHEDEIAVYNEVVVRLADATESPLLGLLGLAFVYTGEALAHLGSGEGEALDHRGTSEDEIAAYDKLSLASPPPQNYPRARCLSERSSTRH